MKNSILSNLPGDFPWQVYWFQSIPSTNDMAKQLARTGAPHGTVVVAGQQSAGRGRMGRDFFSPAGMGMYLSVLLRPNVPATQLMHLTCAVGCAVCDAVASVTGLRPGIKWVNDLIVHDRKLGGILTELAVDPGTGLVDYAVAGIGINCMQDREDFPLQLQDTAISLKTATGQPPSLPRLVAAILSGLHQMDGQLLTHRDRLMERYRQSCVTLGREVTVHRGDAQYHGLAVDIDDMGGLIVKSADGSTQTFLSGEVSVRGPGGYM